MCYLINNFEWPMIYGKGHQHLVGIPTAANVATRWYICKIIYLSLASVLPSPMRRLFIFSHQNVAKCEYFVKVGKCIKSTNELEAKEVLLFYRWTCLS